MDITKRNVKSSFFGLLQRFLAAGTSDDDEAFLTEVFNECFTDQQFVVHHENGCRGGRFSVFGFRMESRRCIAPPPAEPRPSGSGGHSRSLTVAARRARSGAKRRGTLCLRRGG